MAAVMDTHAQLTAAVQQAAGRMAHAEHSAQFDAARKEHDAARVMLEAYNAQHSDD
jgi:hypothetical protein